MTNYKKLEVWKQSMLLVKDTYQLVKMYQQEERYALTSQTKRAVISIPCNIAEGSGRYHKKDTLQFLHIARGSLYELETLLNIAVMVEVLPEEQANPIIEKIDTVMKLLNGFINYYKKDKAG